MRLVIARMKHETNTFSPVPTPLDPDAAPGPMSQVLRPFSGYGYYGGYRYRRYTGA